ncbi:hypothetical protein [Actinoplanes sp. NPDC020271]|uniref:hypothetical protein n=1 Tax=Actinoplanes sp. NPDC020271 TaxID=3363896 RepID=UPI00379FA93A
MPPIVLASPAELGRQVTCNGDARHRSRLDHVDVQIEAWLNRVSQFIPGQEIFRSERDFSVWAYTVSHRQLLLRSRPTGGQSRIDVLFKPVRVMKMRTEFDGLVIRCGTTAERDRILASTGLAGKDLHVLMVGTAAELDYVVAGAVGWREDDGQDNEPSSLAFFPPGGDPNRLLPAADPGSAE